MSSPDYALQKVVVGVAKGIAAARFGTQVDQTYWDQESDAWRRAHLDMAEAAIAVLCHNNVNCFDARTGFEEVIKDFELGKLCHDLELKGGSI